MPDQPPNPESPWGREPPTGPEWASYDPTRPSPVQDPGASGGGRTVLVTLLVVAVLVVAGIVVTVVALAGRDDATPTAAATSSRTTDTPSGTPSDTPTEPSPSAPSPSAPSAPATEDTGPVDPGSAFSYTEYGDDWDFRFGDVALQATFQQGWDYPDCTSVEVGDALTSIGCVRASEWTLRALDDRLAMTHVVLTFDTPSAAEKAVALIASDSFTVEPEGLLGGDASTGTFKADNVTNQPFVVLTVETHDPVVRQAKADQFRAYGTADIVAALGFRF